MGCNCTDNREAIEDARSHIEKLRELFIKRMTIDSEHSDRRKRDFNQAIFFYDEYNNEHIQCFHGTTMEMVLQCFDDAVRDWRRTWCDSETCRRK